MEDVRIEQYWLTGEVNDYWPHLISLYWIREETNRAMFASASASASALGQCPFGSCTLYSLCMMGDKCDNIG